MFVVLNFTSPMSSTSRYSEATNNVCMFQRTQPTVTILLVYGLAVPTLSSFGLCTNFINCVVFMRPKMTPSAFSYLAALSCLDCISCLLITLTALSRSYFYKSAVWTAYDYQWQTPLFGISTGAANLMLACLSLDRLIYLSRCRVSNGAPRFCRRKVARRMICGVILVSIIVNMPYFFIFVVDLDTATCHVTPFYYSKIYEWHNWFSFAFLALLPALFLLVGNTVTIIVFRRWTKQSKLCHQSNTNETDRTTQKRFQVTRIQCKCITQYLYPTSLQHQMKLTISIVIVITLYMVGELPAHMTSRKSSLNLLFGGDANKVDEELMEQLEVIFITLNALQLSLNIVVYGVINPSFMPEFFVCMRNTSDVCFNLCCLPALSRGCRRCWDWTQRRDQPTAEERVVSCAAPLQLPADEAPNCGCESWSSDSGCENDAHCRTATGTFAFVDEFDCHEAGQDPQPEVFLTKASAHMLPGDCSHSLNDEAHFIVLT
ncbi:hypothetical protein KR093_003498 [Drosophila rubida]|uniref:G-protein coupled receptors family 1 profile domain-containing protein n=1 Tax=Drosophila rubida TaxID=30044 RepID=A0AAD4JQZ5_9MUSC|nr:hypothetical protein KR093_003498 [Drosophila rubida]